MLGGKIGAHVAAFSRPSVAFFETDFVVVAVVHPHLQHAFHIHLLHLLLAQPVFHPEKLVKQRIVKALGAQKPDVELDGPPDFADLAAPHHGRDGSLAAHPHQSEALQPPLRSLGESQRVRRIGVAAARSRKHFLFVGRHRRDGFPASLVAFQMRDERAVYDAVIQTPDEYRRDQPAVLP